MLVRVPLAPMRPGAAEAVPRESAGGGQGEVEAAAGGLVSGAAASGGNPGLQEMLTRPLLHGETAAAAGAIAAVEAFLPPGSVQRRGNPASSSGLSFGTYAEALTGAQRQTLAAATVLSRGPDSAPGLGRRRRGARGRRTGAALDRLLALGLLDDWELIPAGAERPCCRTRPSTRWLDRSGVLPEADAARVAAAARPLGAAWRDAEGDFPFDLAAWRSRAWR